jgi:hypothetical protein
MVGGDSGLLADAVHVWIASSATCTSIVCVEPGTCAATTFDPDWLAAVAGTAVQPWQKLDNTVSPMSCFQLIGVQVVEAGGGGVGPVGVASHVSAAVHRTHMLVHPTQHISYVTYNGVNRLV